MADNKDIFGFTHTNKIGGVASFQNVAIKVGAGENNQIMLAQRADLQYRRVVTPVMGAGTAAVYLIPQPGTGTLRVDRAITGDGGLLAQFEADDACKEQNVELTTVKNGCKNAPKGSVKGSGLLSAVGVTVIAGQGLGLTDLAEWSLSTVTRTGGSSSGEQQAQQ